MDTPRRPGRPLRSTRPAVGAASAVAGAAPGDAGGARRPHALGTHRPPPLLLREGACSFVRPIPSRAAHTVTCAARRLQDGDPRTPPNTLGTEPTFGTVSEVGGRWFGVDLSVSGRQWVPELLRC